jgi:hypothetical protein
MILLAIAGYDVSSRATFVVSAFGLPTNLLTTIFAKYYIPHQFCHYIHPVPCWQPVISLCFLHQYSSFSQYDMIEAKLGNELGFLRALISCSCHLLVWKKRNKYMNKV